MLRCSTTAGRRISILLGVVALLLSAQFSQVLSVGARIPSAELTSAVVPDLHDLVAEQIAGKTPEYRVSARFTPAGEQAARIEGTTQLRFVNFTTEPLSEVYVRLYPNSTFYESNGIELTNLYVNGTSAAAELSQNDSLATISLEAPLLPGEAIDLEISFISTIPTDPGDGYAMFAYDTSSDSYNLGYWQPLLAGWTPEDGWNTGEILNRGDPVFTNTGFFTVELTAPSELVFVTTGVETLATTQNDTTTYRWESGPVRDFVMIANSAFTVLEESVGETVVRSFTTPESGDAAQLALDTAVASLTFFNERVGLYPYREFDIAESDIGPRAAGIEFPGLIYISNNLYDPDNFSLVFTIVHEVAHQYWYNLIGNNQYQHAFLDESLANYTAVLFLEEVYGPDVAEIAIERYLTRAYLASLYGQDGDAIVDQPTADFVSDMAYGRIIYGKGAIGMHMIRQEIGWDAFFAGLRQYVDSHRFGVTTSTDLLSAFEEASGQDLQQLWSHWFDEMHGLEDFTPNAIIELD